MRPSDRYYKDYRLSEKWRKIKPPFKSANMFRHWYADVSKAMWKHLLNGKTIDFVREPTKLFLCRESVYTNKIILQFNNTLFYFPARLRIVPGFHKKIAKIDPSTLPVWDEADRVIEYNYKTQRYAPLTPFYKDLVTIDRKHKMRVRTSEWVLNRLISMLMLRLAPRWSAPKRKHSEITGRYGLFGFHFGPMPGYFKGNKNMF